MVDLFVGLNIFHLVISVFGQVLDDLTWTLSGFEQI